MRVDQAEIEDLPLIVDMKLRMFREVGSYGLLREGAEEMILQSYAALYREGLCRHYILRDGAGQAVAIGGAVIKAEVPFCFFQGPGYGYVMDVYTVPEARGQGHATRIMEAVLAWLKERGVRQVKLKPSGAGRALYGRMGFQDAGEMEKWL